MALVSPTALGVSGSSGVATLSCSNTEYADALADLLPNGRLWDGKKIESADPEARPEIRKFLRGLSHEYARVCKRIDDYIREVIPCDTVESLEDWERVLALPRDCEPEPTTPLTTAQRQERICAALASAPASTLEEWENVAAGLGYTITVAHNEYFYAGKDCAGDFLCSVAAIYNVKITAMPSGPNDDQLACLIEEACPPSHTCSVTFV